MKTNRISISAVALTAVLATAFLAPVRADVIMDWSSRADTIAADKKLTSPAYVRTLAMLHVAMFEAVNAIDHRYAPYRLNLIADRDTSHEAAAAAAGHAILVALYADLKPDLDAQLAAALARVPEGHAKERGIILGRRAAEELLELRAQDGSDAVDTYRPTTTPGVYVPTAAALNYTVGGWTPWVMKSPAEFHPAAPPSLTSEVWTRDVNEIREVGRLGSTTRTAEQTMIGTFWFISGGRTYNPIVKQIVEHRSMDLVDCARLYALASMAAMDAYIAVFEAKYAYNFWRPVTAIRNADLTGNPATPRDPAWLPLGDTPMHPEYPCAHCIVSAAVATVLTATVGDDIGEITMTSAFAPGATRKWTRLSDYSNEVSNARVWAGFHYRFSTDVGRAMGTKIGALTAETQLLARKHARR
jgi:hypothetical protein